jgi:hypothetical protein
MRLNFSMNFHQIENIFLIKVLKQNRVGITGNSELPARLDASRGDATWLATERRGVREKNVEWRKSGADNLCRAFKGVHMI